MFHIFTETVLFFFLKGIQIQTLLSVFLACCLSLFLSLFFSNSPVRLFVCLSVSLSLFFFFVSFVLLNYGILFQMRSKQNNL